MTRRAFLALALAAAAAPVMGQDAPPPEAGATIRAGLGPATPDRVREARLFRRAFEAQDQGRPGEAIAIYLDLVRATGDRMPEALHNLALAYRAAGRADEALAAARRATELASSSATAWNTYGVTLCEAGRPEEATEAWRRAASLASTYAAPLANLAHVAHRDGLVEEARELADRALALDAADPRANLVRAMIAESEGDSAGALRHYDAYLGAARAHELAWARVRAHRDRLESALISGKRNTP